VVGKRRHDQGHLHPSCRGVLDFTTTAKAIGSGSVFTSQGRFNCKNGLRQGTQNSPSTTNLVPPRMDLQQ
jgi:hypothetical protein